MSEKVLQDGWVYVKIRKGMYALQQSGLLAQELLQERLVKNRYKQSKLTSGL